jgi:hypothetical protein
MIVAEPIFMRLTLAEQLFIKDYYREFHENPRNFIVAGTRSKKDGIGRHIRHSLFTL